MAIKTKQTGIVLALYIALALPLHAQDFFDDFDDNTNTGWSYLDRSAGTALATTIGGTGAPTPTPGLFVEQNGRLEQTVDNYTFPNNGGPSLGGIALAPGTYDNPTIQLDMISLEPGNGNQDQDIVFGYQDEDNFFYVETIANGGLNFFSVIDGVRAGRGGAGGNTFMDTATTVELSHNRLLGNVQITYDLGGAAENIVSVTDPVFQLDGAFAVGVGSNNDAFAIDNFSITETEICDVGDANCDGTVDSEDFQLISNNLFSTVTLGEDGDVDSDGDVDFEDFRIWKNAVPSPLAGASSVPEPTTIWLVFASIAVILGSRKRI